MNDSPADSLRTFVDALGLGFALCELVRDDAGRVVDCRVLERDPLPGGPANDLLPVVDAEWLARLARVADERVPARFEHQRPSAPRWLDIVVIPRGPDRLAMILHDVSDRKRTEVALRASEERYRTLLQSIDQGFAILQPVFDDAARCVDYRFLEINPVFEEQTGLAGALGRTMREMHPDMEPFWFETYGRVALTGEPIRFVHGSEVLGRWFDVYAVRVGPAEARQVAVLFKDVTAAQRREAQLAFLATATDEMGRGRSADELMQLAGARLGAFLGVPTAYVSDIEEATGQAFMEHVWSTGEAPRIPAVARIADFAHEELRRTLEAGQPMVVHDTEHDPRIGAAAFRAIGMRAIAAVPFHDDRGWTHLLTVADVAPRRWRGDEITLLQEFANRLFPRIERARAETARRASDERLHGVVESVSDYAIFSLDLEGRVTSWNDGSRRMFGWVAEEVVGRPVERLYPPEVRADGLAVRQLERALDTGRSEDEGWRLRHDGSRFWCNEIMAPLRDPEGRIVGVTTVSRDLTERRRAEERLRTSEERLRLVMESVADYAILTLDLDGRITSWNAGAARLFGWPAEVVLGQDSGIFFTPEDRARGEPRAEERRAREQGRAEHERWQVTRSGTRVFVGGVLTPLRPAGEVVGYVKVARDLTERKRSEDELRRMRQDAEQANRAKDEFLAVLGHELRNPLAPIVTAMELLRLKGTRLPELEIVDRQVGHMRHLVDDLMDVSRITRGKLELDRQPTELRDAVDRAMEQVGPMLEQRRNEVELDLPGHGLVVDADRNRLAQVLVNLLTNASKYSDPGSRIVLRAQAVDGRVRIAITDQGIGILPEMLGRVFEPFVQQNQSIERSKGGLGLGLAIVRSLVEAHGGEVRAESAGPGRGSTFVVELPAPATPGPARMRERRAVPREATGHGRRVLIVDDNGDAAETLRLALQQIGYEVDVAPDGPSALEHAGRFKPAVILLDIGLPVMDGYEVARRLRAAWDPSHPPRLLAVTGYGQDADRERSRAAGFDEHLVKPINLQQLRRALEERPVH